MAPKQINWSAKAVQDKLAILDYWINRNKSKIYSQKLNLLFDKALAATAQNPESGKPTDYEHTRIKVISHYLIFYRIQPKSIEVIRIWNSRRDLKNLSL
jgi:plasmid stabilization system protein ParE